MFALEQDFERERESDTRRHAPPVLGTLLLVWLVFFSMPRVAGLLRRIFSDVPLTPGLTYGLLVVQQFLCIGLPTLIFFKLDPPSRLSLRPRMRPLSGGAWIALSLGAVATVLALNNLVTLWYLLLDALSVPLSAASIPLPDSGIGLLPALLAIGLMPALCEELLMRGLVLPSLEIRGSRFAVLMSGLLFGLMHGQMIALPAHVLLGFLLGWLLVGYGSLWAPVLFHAVYNAFSTLLSYAGAHMADDAPTLADISAAEYVAPCLVRLLLFALVAAALLHYPMRASARKNPPPVFVPGDRRLTLVEKLVLGLLLLAFFSQYRFSAGVGT